MSKATPTCFGSVRRSFPRHVTGFELELQAPWSRLGLGLRVGPPRQATGRGVLPMPASRVHYTAPVAGAGKGAHPTRPLAESSVVVPRAA